MTIIEIKSQFDVLQPEITALVVGDETPFSEAEALFQKHHPDTKILQMTVYSTQVINQWAQ